MPGYRACGTLDTSGMKLYSGNSFLVLNFATGGNSNELPNNSHVMIFENLTALGPQYSTIQNIVNLGFGRFNHWGTRLYFSSSDNSNPMSNGRTYWWGVPNSDTCPSMFTP